jgi:hypothetical protein
MSNEKLLALLLLGVACGGNESPAAESGSPATGGNVTGGNMAVTAGAGTTQDQGWGGTGANVAGEPGSSGGTAGMASTAGAPPAMAGAASGGAGVAGSPAAVGLSVQPPSLRWTAVRHYSGATPSGRTSGPAMGPTKKLTVHNGGASALTLAVALSGPGAARFELITPAMLQVPAGDDAEVTLRIITDDSALGAAPAQDDGATVLDATLKLSAGGQQLSVGSYALVLTYVELEPTFGQILGAFPEWTTHLPTWLPNDANPNPGKPLPGIVAGTDEVQAPSFERLDPSKPVTLRPIARFSPAGAVPFGWYEPGRSSSRTTVATLGQQPDPHTNDQSRMLEPPLASGSFTFEPSAARFGVWMMPAGVGLLTSEDASCFDGQHRVRAWSLRDAQGVLIPGSFLIGGEEAANGDYQDYVFVLGNVKPSAG